MKTPKDFIIGHGGVDYVALRAAPIITDGFFSARELARMLGYPDEYCDATHSEILTAHRFGDDGLPMPHDHEYFARLADQCRRSNPKDDKIALRALPAGAVVRLDVLRAKFTEVTTGVYQSPFCKRTASVPRWDLGRPLSKALLTLVRAGLRKPRANNLSEQLRAIGQLVGQIEAWAASQGKPFDRKAMPGTKDQFIAAICRALPRVSRARLTLNDHLKLAGLRWKQGARPLEPYWPAEALRNNGSSGIEPNPNGGGRN